MADDALKPRFYTDKHIPRAVTAQLRQHGVDITRCEEVGLGDAPDLTHLEWASKENRVVITGDADFARLHATWQAEGREHAGIMFCQSHIQGADGVGKIVSVVLMYHELITGGAGTVEADITNRLIYVG